MTVPPFSKYASHSAVAGGVVMSVIPVNCELVRGTEARLMEDLLPRVQQESVALNLSAVERIDAAGIAALIRLYCSSHAAGKDFTVVAPSPHVLDLLRIVGLESILVAGARQAGELLPCLECPAA